MRVVTNNDHLDCRGIDKSDLFNRAIKSDTKGRYLLKLQEEQLDLWESFVYQKVAGQVSVKKIVTNVDKQYIKLLHQKYMGYNKRTIPEMLAQLGTWLTITNTENIKMRKTSSSTGPTPPTPTSKRLRPSSTRGRSNAPTSR